VSEIKKTLGDVLSEVKNQDSELRFSSAEDYKAFLDGIASFGEQFSKRVAADQTAGTTTSATVSYPEGTDPYDSD
jgi:hypothetical protein